MKKKEERCRCGCLYTDHARPWNEKKKQFDFSNKGPCRNCKHCKGYKKAK